MTLVSVASAALAAGALLAIVVLGLLVGTAAVRRSPGALLRTE